jgi:hypothetical protein
VGLTDREVCCVVLRAVFNYLRYDERVQNGSLDPPVPKPAHRRRVARDLAAGQRTKALFDLFDRDGITLLARTFDWLEADGTVGNWGKRDPKWLRVAEEAWTPPHDRAGHYCTSCRLYNERYGSFEPAPSPCGNSDQGPPV